MMIISFRNENIRTKKRMVRMILRVLSVKIKIANLMGMKFLMEAYWGLSKLADIPMKILIRRRMIAKLLKRCNHVKISTPRKEKKNGKNIELITRSA